MSDSWISWVVLVLRIVGCAVVLWVLFGDWCRQRLLRRRRCPKCWYDMSATPGLRCSECGFLAASERRLLKARRRWWMVAAALAMFLLSHGLNVMPQVKQRGWLAALPTTVLIFVTPVSDEAWKQSSWRHGRILGTPVDPVLTELVERCNARQLYGWQWRILLTRFFREHPDQLAGTTLTRDAWPAGMGVQVRLFRPSAWFRRHDQDVIVRTRIAGSDDPWHEYVPKTLFGPSSGAWSRHDPGDVDEIRLEIEVLLGAQVQKDRRTVNREETYLAWRGLSAPITIAGKAGDYMTPFHTDRSDKAIGGLRPRLKLHPDGDVQFVLFRVGHHIGSGWENWALGMRVEVHHGDEIVATGSMLYHLHDPGVSAFLASASVICDLEWLVEQPDVGMDGYTVRLYGDPSIAIYDVRRDSYWAGDITVPLPAVAAFEDWELLFN